jgi:hypothetical protein
MAEPLIEDILAATPAVIALLHKCLRNGFPQRVLDALLEDLPEPARQLEAMPGT